MGNCKKITDLLFHQPDRYLMSSLGQSPFATLSDRVKPWMWNRCAPDALRCTTIGCPVTFGKATFVRAAFEVVGELDRQQ